MALPVTIPNTFANATASIPLSQLDTNFTTLANAVNGISDGSETLANASVTVLTAGTVDINGGAIDGTTVGTSNAAAGSFTTLNTSGAVVFNDAGADVDFRVEGDTEANLLFVDASADSIGIGTSSPNLTSFQKAVTLGDGSGTATRYAYEINGGQSSADSSIGDFNVYNKGSLVSRLLTVRGSADNSGVLTFYTSNAGTSAERMRIDSSGNVGIGTSSPSRQLVVYGSAPYLALQNSTTGATSGDGLQIQQDGNNAYIWNYENSFMSFGTNGSERMRITSGGYLKASNTGSYNSSTASYHEFNNSTNNIGLLNRVTNASFGSNNALYYGSAAPSASSGYRLLELNSSAGNDIEFNLRGDGNAYADGSWNGSGADYAEYFESATGEEIPRGTTVVLENNKVRAATADDPASSIIGVVRPKEFGKGSMVVGNLAWNMWTDKYLTDDFGVYEMEDHEVVEWEETITDEEGNTSTKPHSYESHAIPEGVTLPADATRKTHDENGKKFQHRKLNPNYDPAVEYTPREERPEWLIIGLLGQVPVLKGQPVGDRWVKMRDISETVEEWFIR